MDAAAASASPPTPGLQERIRARLFYSPGAALVTLAIAALLLWALWRLFGWGVLHAVAAPDIAACKAAEHGAACWGFVAEKWRLILFGRYPYEQQWRPALATGAVLAMLVLSALPPFWSRRGARALAAGWVLAFGVFFLLMRGGVFGLEAVGTERWGGLPLTVILTLIGIAASTPIGVLLALARRSSMGLVRSLAVAYIELVRGVPLITVLFMANTMLPLFVPQEYSPDRLLRPLIGVALFAAAYMAEVIRGGLQAIPKGQYEGAMSLGLGYWQMMRLIILPQALRIVIPGIVNTFIGLFKDTTLVTIVGIFDFLRTIEATLVDPTWATPTTRATGYAFAAIFYFLCCWGMSRYSIAVERRLAAGQKR
jgi:general L-amino acid transport system permease protein